MTRRIHPTDDADAAPARTADGADPGADADAPETAAVGGDPPGTDGAGEAAAPATASRPVVVPETAVPPGETPAAVCPYCDRPFRTVRRCDLHVGAVHPDVCGPDERAAYEAAHEAESDDLFVFHLKVLFALGAVYAAFIVTAVIAFSVAG